MGSVGGMLGLSGGAGGSGFSGPGGVDLMRTVSDQQLKDSYSGNQGALGEQQGLLDALKGAGGIGNQSQVYNQLQGVVNGTGPNPAQAMLNNSTGQNIANQAALMAGQRGSGSNVGLMARQAAQTGAGIQQGAVGQGAALQAQQSLNALTGAGNIAGQQVSNQMAGTTANTQAQQNEQNQLLGAAANYNSAKAGVQANINNNNAALAQETMKGGQQMIGGVGQAVGAAVGLAEGGAVPAVSGPMSSIGQFLKGWKKDPDPLVAQSQQQEQQKAPDNTSTLQRGTKDFASSMINLMKPGQGPAPVATVAGGSGDAGSQDPGTMQAASGGEVPALVSPGEKYLAPKDVEKVKRGANPMQVGETIPGKPKVGGPVNSYANDFVRKDLQAGGIVVPRSETKSENPERNSEAFVRAILAKRKVK